MTRIDVKPERLFRVKCAWCGKTTRFSTIENSHSICDTCKDDVLLAEELARPKQK